MARSTKTLGSIIVQLCYIKYNFTHVLYLCEYICTVILSSDLDSVFATTGVSMINNPPTFIPSMWLGVLIRRSCNYNVTSTFGNRRPVYPFIWLVYKNCKKVRHDPSPQASSPNINLCGQLRITVAGYNSCFQDFIFLIRADLV